MKKFILLFSSFILSFGISLSALSTRPLEGGDSDFEPSEDATHIPAMILVNDGDVDETIASLEEKGVIVLRHRHNILLTLVPVETESTLRRVRGVGHVDKSKPRFNQPLMDHARYFNDAYIINEGESLPQPYDGKGVVVGVCDIGMDTRHPNFLNSDGTECRIRRVVHYKELQGLRTVLSTPQEIYDWETDNRDDWHATHVTGIAAGAFREKVGYNESGYQSLAPAADIVFTASQLSDVGLLAGVEDIIEYAKSVGKPAVINLSMGNYVGPHDGTSLFARYLDYCAEDAIICLSAGNEGEGYKAGEGTPKSMSFDFTEAAREVRVLPNDWGGVDSRGEAEVWSKDDTPFAFSFYWNNNSSYAKREDRYPALSSPDGSIVEWRISVDPESPDYDEWFATHFTEGYVEVKTGISPLNGRYYANMQYEVKTDERHGNNPWAEYWTGIKVEGEPGTHVDIFCGGGSFLRRERNFPIPDNNICFSDLATGFKTISVGMMNSTAVDENAAVGSGKAEGEVSVFSSYGTLVDGRKMPLTVAPGAYVISSISSAYLNDHSEDLAYVDHSATFNGETYYWIGTLGTSMSCPFVVSAIATWLQAYPLLKSEDAVDIIERTNRTTGYPDLDNPRHGRGWFNALAGMEEVLAMAALKIGTVDSPQFTAKVVGNRLLIGNPTGETLHISVYSMSGMAVGRFATSQTTDSFTLDGVMPGIYLIRIESPGAGSTTIKIAI